MQNDEIWYYVNNHCTNLIRSFFSHRDKMVDITTIMITAILTAAIKYEINNNEKKLFENFSYHYI
jgi:hypothetical protein